MRITTHRQFDKAYAKVSKAIKEKFKQRRDLFLISPFHPLLKNHALTGEYGGCRSINIAGDWRAIYREKGAGTVEFLKIGTHGQLYR